MRPASFHITAALAAAALSLLLGPATPARAQAVFDPDTGRLSIDTATYAVGLDTLTSVPSELSATFLADQEGNPVPAAQIPFLFEEDPGGLEGDGALVMGGDVMRVWFSLRELPRFRGRRIEIRIWQRPEGTRARFYLHYRFFDAADPDSVAQLSSFAFLPTGRATDDGWQEWTSGPIDYSAGGVVPVGFLEFVDEQAVRWGQYHTADLDLRVRIDALTIDDLGPAAVPPVDCTATDEQEICGSQGTCLMGRCVDAAITHGGVPLDPQLRDDYLTRKLFEFRTFEGSRMSHQLLPILRGAIDALKHEVSPRRFWPTLRNSVDALRDGHASAGSRGWTAAGDVSNLGVCVHYGEADLLPDPHRAPIIFTVAHENPVADQLAVGDVLIDIDGLEPYTWARQNPRLFSLSGDPANYEVAIAPRLITAAATVGARVTFARCARSGPNPPPCSAGEVETITIDYKKIADETVWAGTLVPWLGDNASCDYRFRRGTDHPRVKRYNVASFQDDGPIRTLIINGLPDMFGDAGRTWAATVLEALDDPPPYLIFDQRTGRGGSVVTTDFLMGLLLTEADFDRMEIVPIFERPEDDALWTTLDSCIGEGGSDDCGSQWTWDLHEMSRLDNNERGIAGGTKIAVLNGVDISGNDFTTRLFTHRAAPTRIFGTGSTAGAFGPIASLPGFLDELGSGGSMQFWDTLFLVHPDDPRVSYTTGVGIRPDEDIVQKQSDAVQGIDTLIERAKAWLMEP